MRQHFYKKYTQLWLPLKAFSLVIVLLYLENIKIECLVSETMIMIMTTTVMFISRFLKTTRKQSVFN